MIAGHTEYGISSLAASYQFVQSGKLIPIMQSGKTRSSTYPNVPTALELGFTGPTSTTWFGVFTRKDTSNQAVDKFSSAVGLIVANNKKIQEFKSTGMDIINLPSKPAEKFLNQQIQHFEQQKQ